MESIVGRQARYYWMGVAMIWIVLFHWMNPICEYQSISCTLRQTLLRIFGSGFIGVDIFLFLSSYGLCFSFENNNYLAYLYRRLKRLFPVFLIFIVSYLYFIVGVTDVKTLLITTLYHITGLSSFSSVSYAWYIPATILIYWSFPFWFYTVKWLESRHKVILWVFFMSILIIKPIATPYIFWLMNGRLVMVVLGILTYIWLHNKYNRCNQRLVLFFAIPAILAMFFGQSKAEIVGVSLPLIFYSIDKSGMRHYGEKFVSFIGQHTLEIYLAQCVAIEAFALHIPQWFGVLYMPEPILWAIAMILEIIITIVLAWILYQFQSKFWFNIEFLKRKRY